MTREEHLAWAKGRALQYVEQGDFVNAWASMCSDLNKHDELRNHTGLMLGMGEMLIGTMTKERMKRLIEGFN